MAEILIDGNCPLCHRRNHAPLTCEQDTAEQARAVRALMPPLADERTAKVINDLISERRSDRERIAELERLRALNDSTTQRKK